MVRTLLTCTRRYVPLFFLKFLYKGGRIILYILYRSALRGGSLWFWAVEYEPFVILYTYSTYITFSQTLCPCRLSWYNMGMAGHTKRRNERNAANPFYGGRWCDREGYVGPSRGPEGYCVYLMCTREGFITVHEEYVCWLIARGDSQRSAFRRVHWPKKRTGKDCIPKPKMRKRIEDLREMHEEGVIDLEKGPWDYYGLDIGNENAYYR